jgi:pimeloyl-ACP methyl ester carboxylesterase
LAVGSDLYSTPTAELIQKNILGSHDVRADDPRISRDRSHQPIQEATSALCAWALEVDFANFNPKAGTKANFNYPLRGPLLIISGELDNAVPRALTTAAFNLQGRNENKTEFIEIAGRGHSLVIDSGWQEVADTTLKFTHQNLSV